VGHTWDGVPGQNSDFGMMKFFPDGSLDTSFGIQGHVITDYSSNSDDLGLSAELQLNGKILLSGRTYTNGLMSFALLRYESTGIPDNSYGTSGFALADFGVSWFQVGWAMALQSDEKVILAGFTGENANEDIAVARFNSDHSVNAVAELSNQHSSITVFPNPGKGVFDLILTDTELYYYQLNILSLDGQLIESSTLQGQAPPRFSIDLTHLAYGMYFVQLKGKTGVINSKLVIQK
jgi:uncharacterized delta-60 repeat protein